MTTDFINALQECYTVMLKTENGNRSTNKVKPIHLFLVNEIQKRLPEKDYQIHSLHNGEKTIEGRYYNKKVDVAVMYKDKHIGGISVKLVAGNFKQNSNNYFEHLLGETANLRTNNYKYASFSIFPKYMPYYKKDRTLDRLEIIKTSDLTKYYKLSSEQSDYHHKPDIMYIGIINTGTKDFLDKNLSKQILHQKIYEHVNVELVDVNKDDDFNEQIKDFISAHSNLNKFLDSFASLMKVASYGK